MSLPVVYFPSGRHRLDIVCGYRKTSVRRDCSMVVSVVGGGGFAFERLDGEGLRMPRHSCIVISSPFLSILDNKLVRV